MANLEESIVDTGIGIASDSLSKLFKPFSRLGAEKLGIDGTEIGLHLCKQIIELMNGSIGVESERKHGGAFWVELPHVVQYTDRENDTEVITIFTPPLEIIVV